MAELVLLAIPTVAQMASYTVMQFIDTWLLAQISDQAATAASNSGIFAWSAISFGMGVLALVNTLVSQNFGRRDLLACGSYLWQGIWFGVFYSALLFPMVLLVERAFAGFGHSAGLLHMEQLYLRIVVLSSVVKFAGAAMGQFLLAVDRPRYVLISALAGVTVNVGAACLLVLGWLGVPRMGVAGAAWAQNIGVTVEMLTLVYFVTRPMVRRTYNVGAWRLRTRELRTLLATGVPSGIQYLVDVLAWGLFAAWIIAFLGDKAMAANTYVFRFMSVSFMPAIGIGTAVTALVGRHIGAGRADLASRRAHLGFALSVMYMGICGLVYFFGRGPLMSLFTSDPEVHRMGTVLLVFAAVYQCFDAMYIIYIGALRGAGDTLVPAIVTGILNWSLTLGGGYVMARFVPGLGIAGPWISATAYGIALGLFMLIRFRLGGWRSINLVRNASSKMEGASAKVEGPVCCD